MTDDIVFSKKKHIGIITLNRPKALNALNHAMINAMHATLKEFEANEAIHAVIVKQGNCNAFCAGGDVRFLYDAGLKKDPQQLLFFKDEFALNQYIYDYKKPYISFLDGLTMGGGVGISLHGKYTVASEKFNFAMPETSIGFFPDIGSSHFLSRCPDGFGNYLGLTGNRINAHDASLLGLITNIIASDKFDEVMERLIDCDLKTSPHEKVSNCLSKFEKPVIPSTILPIRDFVAMSFQQNSVEEIFTSLSKAPFDWHQKTLVSLKEKSPLSLKVTLRLLNTAVNRSLKECLELDFCLVKHFMQGKDFYEGVRALLVDKDKKPKWQPPELNLVTNQLLDEYFGSSFII